MLKKLAFALLALQVSSTSFAEEREILAVGTEFAYLFEKNANAEAQGFAVDILKTLAQRSGYKLRFEFYPWARAQYMVEQGQAQILIGPYKTPQREQKFNFAQRPFYHDQMVFYVRKGEGRSWQGYYPNLYNQRVAVVQGWVYGDEFEKHQARFKLSTVTNLSTGLSLLVAGRFDYLAANIRNTEGILRTWRADKDLIALDTGIQQQDGYFAYCKSGYCDVLRQHFEHGFQELIASGEMAKLAKSYPLKFPG